jgi:hypothetical protein
VKIRLLGTRDECEQWVAREQATGAVVEVCGWYPNRGTSALGRLYVQTRPLPDPQPPYPAGGCLLTGPHSLLVAKALEYLAAAVPARRSEVNAALVSLGGWHAHPGPADCPPDCPARPTTASGAAGCVARQENPS